MIRSKFALTAAASTGVPSENVASSRRVKVNSVASSLISQDSARNGTISPVSGSWSVSVSAICREIVRAVSCGRWCGS